MKVVTLKSPGGLDQLQVVEREAPGEPGPGRSACGSMPARSTSTTMLWSLG